MSSAAIDLIRAGGGIVMPESALRGWFARQWSQIRGNVKWDFIKYLAGGLLISSVYALWKALQNARFEPFLFATILLLSAALFFYSSHRGSVQFDFPLPNNVESPKVADPRKPDLRAEFLELLFHLERHGLANDVFVLSKIRVVNHGEQETVVTEWALAVQVGEASLRCEEQPIPQNWQILRTPLLGNPTPEAIDRDASSFLGPLKKGVPKTRWINFQVHSIPYRILPPHNAKFILTLTDSFGISHVTEWGPGFMIDTGEIGKA